MMPSRTKRTKSSVRIGATAKTKIKSKTKSAEKKKSNCLHKGMKNTKKYG